MFPPTTQAGPLPDTDATLGTSSVSAPAQPPADYGSLFPRGLESLITAQGGDGAAVKADWAKTYAAADKPTQGKMLMKVGKYLDTVASPTARSAQEIIASRTGLAAQTRPSRSLWEEAGSGILNAFTQAEKGFVTIYDGFVQSGQELTKAVAANNALYGSRVYGRSAEAGAGDGDWDSFDNMHAFAQGAGQGLGSMLTTTLPMLAAPLLGPAAPLAVAGGLASGYAQGFSEAFDQLTEGGLDATTAYNYASVIAVPVALAEYLPVKGLEKAIAGPLVKAVTSNAVKRLAEKGFTQAAFEDTMQVLFSSTGQAIKAGVPHVARGAAFGGASEGAEEFIQNMLTQIGTKLTGKLTNTPGLAGREIEFKAAFEDAAMGAILGGVLGGGGGAARLARSGLHEQTAYGMLSRAAEQGHLPQRVDELKKLYVAHVEESWGDADDGFKTGQMQGFATSLGKMAEAVSASRSAGIVTAQDRWNLFHLDRLSERYEGQLAELQAQLPAQAADVTTASNQLTAFDPAQQAETPFQAEADPFEVIKQRSEQATLQHQADYLSAARQYVAAQRTKLLSDKSLDRQAFNDGLAETYYQFFPRAAVAEGFQPTDVFRRRGVEYGQSPDGTWASRPAAGGEWRWASSSVKADLNQARREYDRLPAIVTARLSGKDLDESDAALLEDQDYAEVYAQAEAQASQEIDYLVVARLSGQQTPEEKAAYRTSPYKPLLKERYEQGLAEQKAAAAEQKAQDKAAAQAEKEETAAYATWAKARLTGGVVDPEVLALVENQGDAGRQAAALSAALLPTLGRLSSALRRLGGGRVLEHVPTAGDLQALPLEAQMQLQQIVTGSDGGAEGKLGKKPTARQSARFAQWMDTYFPQTNEPTTTQRLDEVLETAQQLEQQNEQAIDFNLRDAEALIAAAEQRLQRPGHNQSGAERAVRRARGLAGRLATNAQRLGQLGQLLDLAPEQLAPDEGGDAAIYSPDTLGGTTPDADAALVGEPRAASIPTPLAGQDTPAAPGEVELTVSQLPEADVASQPNQTSQLDEQPRRDGSGATSVPGLAAAPGTPADGAGVDRRRGERDSLPGPDQPGLLAPGGDGGNRAGDVVPGRVGESGSVLSVEDTPFAGPDGTVMGVIRRTVNQIGKKKITLYSAVAEGGQVLYEGQREDFAVGAFEKLLPDEVLADAPVPEPFFAESPEGSLQEKTGTGLVLTLNEPIGYLAGGAKFTNPPGTYAFSFRSGTWRVVSESGEGSWDENVVNEAARRLSEGSEIQGRLPERVRAESSTAVQNQREDARRQQSSSLQNLTDAGKAKLLARLKTAFPAVLAMNVPTQEDMDIAWEREGAKGKTPLGFVDKTGVAWLSPEASADTPIHEFGHVWTSWAKKYAPDRYWRGIALAQQNPALMAATKAAYPELRGEALAEEALVELIGQRGAAQWAAQSEAGWMEKVANWLSGLWKAVAAKLGLSDYGNLDSMNIETFADLVAGDLLSGETISWESGRLLVEGEGAVRQKKSVAPAGTFLAADLSTRRTLDPAAIATQATKVLGNLRSTKPSSIGGALSRLMLSKSGQALWNADTLAAQAGKGSALEEILVRTLGASDERASYLGLAAGELWPRLTATWGKFSRHQNLSEEALVGKHVLSVHRNGAVEDVELPVATIASLYATYTTQMDDSGASDLTYSANRPEGGGRIERDGHPTLTVSFDAPQLAALSALFETGGQYHDEYLVLREAFENPDRLDAIRKTYEAVTGKVFKDAQSYFATRTWSPGDAKEASRGIRGLVDEKGNLQPRTKRGGVVVIEDALTVASRYLRETEEFVSVAPAVTGAWAWVNAAERGGLSDSPDGKALIEGVRRWAKDLGAGRQPDTSLSGGFISALAQLNVRSIFGFKLGTPIKQLTGYGVAYKAGLMESKYLDVGFKLARRLTIESYRGWVEGEKKGLSFERILSDGEKPWADKLNANPYAGVLRLRAAGRPDSITPGVDYRDIPDGTTGKVGAVRQAWRKTRSAIDDHALAALHRADRAVVYGFYRAALEEYADQNPGADMDSDAALRQVASRATRLMAATNQMYMGSSHAALQRSDNPWDRIFSLFAGQQVRVANLLMQRQAQFAESDFTDADLASQVRWVLGWGIVGQGIAIGGVSTLLRLVAGSVGGDDEEDKESQVLQSWGWESARNVLGSWPGLYGELLTTATTQLDNEPWSNDVGGQMVLETMNTAMVALGDARQWMQTDGQQADRAADEMIFHGMDAVSKLLGVPNAPVKMGIRAAQEAE